MGRLIWLMEVVGYPPPQIALLLFILLDKPKGGKRAICLLSSFVRIWAFVRRPLVEEWKAANDRPDLACGTGRRAYDVAWRCAARAEAALGSREGKAATQLWDMRTYNERFDLRRLHIRGRRLQVHSALWRLETNLYRGPRRFTMGGLVTGPLFAKKGIPAGSKFSATPRGL